ncbi:hypothetical protein LXL04_029504 [Taraxacum kok-saghyz]
MSELEDFELPWSHRGPRGLARPGAVAEGAHALGPALYQIMKEVGGDDVMDEKTKWGKSERRKSSKIKCFSFITFSVTEVVVDDCIVLPDMIHKHLLDKQDDVSKPLLAASSPSSLIKPVLTTEMLQCIGEEDSCDVEDLVKSKNVKKKERGRRMEKTTWTHALQGCSQPVLIAFMHAMASNPPAAPKPCPIID